MTIGQKVLVALLSMLMQAGFIIVIALLAIGIFWLAQSYPGTMVVVGLVLFVIFWFVHEYLET